MTALIEKFKQDHKMLIDTLTSVKQLGIAKKEGQENLMAAKTAFISHLGQEDRELYPALEKAAENDAGLKRKIETFANDMDEISKGVMDFFKKYAAGCDDNMAFSKDFGKLFATIQTRVRKEETILYPEYDKLV